MGAQKWDPDQSVNNYFGFVFYWSSGFLCLFFALYRLEIVSFSRVPPTVVGVRLLTFRVLILRRALFGPIVVHASIIIDSKTSRNRRLGSKMDGVFLRYQVSDSAPSFNRRGIFLPDRGVSGRSLPHAFIFHISVVMLGLAISVRSPGKAHYWEAFSLPIHWATNWTLLSWSKFNR